MTSDGLLGWIRAVPFVPFEILVIDGDRVEVAHPESIAHGHGNRIAIVALPDEDFRIIDLTRVVSLEPILANPS